MTFNMKDGIVRVSPGVDIDIEEARRVLWDRYPHAVRAHTLRTVATDGAIRFDVDWKSVIMLPTSKIILIQHARNK